MSDFSIGAKDMNGLDVAGLKRLLNKQIGMKQKWADKSEEARAVMGTFTTNIHNIRRKINNMQEPQALPNICDHAILRYLERIEGLDIAAIRDKLDSEELRECVKRCPTGRHTINEVVYVTDHGALVTILYGDNYSGKKTHTGDTNGA